MLKKCLYKLCPNEKQTYKNLAYMYTLGDFVPKKKILHHLFVQLENNLFKLAHIA